MENAFFKKPTNSHVKKRDYWNGMGFGNGASNGNHRNRQNGYRPYDSYGSPMGPYDNGAGIGYGSRYDYPPQRRLTEGEIFGIVVGSIFGFLIVLALIVFICLMIRRQRQLNSDRRIMSGRNNINNYYKNPEKITNQNTETQRLPKPILTKPNPNQMPAREETINNNQKHGSNYLPSIIIDQTNKNFINRPPQYRTSEETQYGNLKTDSGRIVSVSSRSPANSYRQQPNV